MSFWKACERAVNCREVYKYQTEILRDVYYIRCPEGKLEVNKYAGEILLNLSEIPEFLLNVSWVNSDYGY